jgi:magnesium transporter
MSMISVDEPQRVAEPAHPPMYVETVLRLYHKGATTQLERIIAKLLPADIAQVIHSADDLEEAADLFEMITDPAQAARTLKELSEEYQSHIISVCTLDRAVAILENLPPDTRSDIIGMLSPEVGDHLMNALRRETQKEVQDLLQYLPETAGSLMTSSFFTLPETTTASAAVQAVREQPNQEFMYYVYVVDENQRLVGVSSIRQMLLSPANKLIRDVMETRLHTVNVDKIGRAHV